MQTNPFDSLNAQSPESRLAQVRSDEILDLQHEQHEMELGEMPNPLDADVLPIDWQAGEAWAYGMGLTQ